MYRTPINGNISAGEKIFGVSGQRTSQTSWQRVFLDMYNTSSFRIAVEAITGLVDHSDIAIDGVSISSDTGKYCYAIFKPTTVLGPM